MTHMEIHEFERLIQNVLVRGFLGRIPDHSFDRADATQAAHDICDFILKDYFVDKKEQDKTIERFSRHFV